jgi:hypothetical protein
VFAEYLLSVPGALQLNDAVRERGLENDNLTRASP